MAIGSVVNAAHFDPNYVPTSMGVMGTLGTSDVSGTALTMAFAVDGSTGAAWGLEIGTPKFILIGGTLNAGTVTTGAGTQKVAGAVNPAVLAAGGPVFIGGTDSGGTVQGVLVNSAGAMSVSGASAGTNNNIVSGTQQTLGTVGTIPGIGIVTRIGNIGTIESGTVTTTLALNTGTLTTIAAGTLNTLGTVGVLNSGTVTALAVGTIGGKAASGVAAVANPVQIAGTDGGGTVYSPLVSTVGALTTNLTSSGTLLNLAAGTLTTVTTVTTVSNLTNGSVNILTGTLQNSGTTTGVGVVSNLTNGSIILQSGTLSTGTLQNLVSGTINALASGTITGGTLGNLNYGTIDLDPVPRPVKTTRTTYGTTGTTGAAVFGTLVASVGNGTYVYIAGYQIVVSSGTVDCAILDGTFAQTVSAGGTNMITRGQFPAGGGIGRDLTVPYVSGTGGTICYWMGGAGTAYFQIDYWAGT